MPAGTRRTLVNNSLWIVLDIAIGIISSIVGSVLVARVMGPSKLGYYAYILWIANVTGQVGAFGIPVATRKFAAEFRGAGDLAGAHRIVAARSAEHTSELQSRQYLVCRLLLE